MASTEEKLLTLLLSVEHLQHTAMEQQKAVADSLAVARETLRGYRDISDGVAKQVRDEVRNEVQKLDVAGLIGERISQDFQRLEESVANMKANADALNRDIATIHSNIVQEYNTLKGYSWKWLGGVSVAFLVMFCVLGWGMKTMLLKFIFFRAKMPFHTLALQDDLQTLLSPGTDPLFWSLICPGSFY
ncbi:hypothetical protein ACGABJ_005387 [Escherichia coli]|jgi:Mg2+ and Co2+ transporter CorA|uniref:Uncharacterized protein n=4 Tax=Enterobacteriaceae TaxID=543 RepID=A0ACC7R621_KLEPN|nr:hypothetical protein AI2858V1_5024 [Escherichia coli]CAH5580905.1 hypothetical protein AI2858V1_5024 [Escherichia coli]